MANCLLRIQHLAHLITVQMHYIIRKPIIRIFYTLPITNPTELSYGIENIFKFFRADLVHRLTYLDHPDTRKFAFKISGVFRF
jgi:hypothetical protein